MTIQPNSATDNAAQIAAQAFSNVKQGQTTTASPGGSSDLQAWSGLALAAGDTDGDIDSTTADQLTQSLTKSMFDNSAAALQAQSGANPQSVLELLQ
jgi:hypothetical protein